MVLIFINNEEAKKNFEFLPENIKEKITAHAHEINSAEELNELVRRLNCSENNKIY